MQERFLIKEIAVLGAGVMGAQIAAHCVNAGFRTRLYDLAPKEGDPNAIVNKAIAHLNKINPSPLATPFVASLLQACNYKEDLTQLKHCDLIIEAIAERADWKEVLYQQVSPHLSPTAIMVTNTSGLSINVLSQALPETQRARFCGVHFFNPPRYMHLAELIPADTTSPVLLDFLESWLTSYLGKGVVRAKDTPNFIANRVGVFSLLATLHHAESMGFGMDEVDALTGALLGRPKSATFRTMDVVGLDTMLHVVKTMQEQLNDDPWHASFVLPDWLIEMVNKGALGQKTGQGVYRKQGKIIEVYDPKQGGYRVSGATVSEIVQKILKETDPAARMQQLTASSDRQAQFLVACFRDLFHYCAYHLEAIAETVRDVDLALRWGFGWQQGPFETWQLAGIQAMQTLIQQAIKNGTALCKAPLPNWLPKLSDFYDEVGAFGPRTQQFIPRGQLPVYGRQFFPDRVLGEKRFSPKPLFENEGVCMWPLQDDVAVVQFKSKAYTIGQSVLDGLTHALDIAERQYNGLIIHQATADNFSAGADLRMVAGLIQTQKMDELDQMLQAFQSLMMRLKYSAIPTVAALRGRALGGGCELILHCSRVVAAFESYPGLVEVGVGLIPAGGGCKEMALRASTPSQNEDGFDSIKNYFEQIAMAVVASSACDARKRGYLRHNDVFVMHKDECLNAALKTVKFMQETNYKPPIPRLFPVVGREGKARLQAALVNFLEGGFISQHDYFIASELANVMCGGEVDEGTLVDEAWFLRLEREAFITLAGTELTQARIAHILTTGKPLRN